MGSGLFDLQRLLGLLRSIPVTVGTFGDEAEGRAILLRHDVDLSLESAVELAAGLRDHGIRGTFFFRLRARGYNIGSRAGQDALRAVAACGHMIGLHWEDISSAGSSPEEVRSSVAADDALLRTLLPSQCVKTNVVSIHRPARSVIGLTTRPPLLSAYAPPFFGSAASQYRSDSNGRFDWAGFEAQLRDPTWRTLQLLIHPVWWMIPASSTTEVYRALVERDARSYAGWLREEIEAFAQQG